jgi:uncharacterized protein with GYD domain
MPRYVSLISWTEQGIKSFRDTVSRADDAARLAEKMGGKLERILWTLGPYDVVTIAEFPDDETGTAFLLALGSQGNIRTTTLRAFEPEEMERIISKVG